MSRLRRFGSDVGYAWRSVRRTPSYSMPVCFTVALAVGVAVAVSAVVDLRSLRPPSLGTPLRLNLLRDPGWAADWSSGLLTSGGMQRAALDGALLALALTAAVTAAIAALTLINLQLARSSERELEQAVQSALGASRLRRGVRLAAEGLWLGGIGGGLGVLLGFALGSALRLSWPHDVVGEGFPGVSILAYGVVLPVLAMVLLPVMSGLAAHGRGSFPRLLRAGERAVAGGGGGLLRDGFAVAQLAASLALLVGAGLLLRVPQPGGAGGRVGLASRDTLVFRLELDASGFIDPIDRVRYYRRLLAEVAELPGVTDTTLSSPGSLAAAGPPGRAQSACGRCFRGGVYVPLLPATVRYHAVGPAFFSRHGIPVLQGREFDEGDGPESPRIAVVSAGFAASHFEGGRAVGKEVRLGGAAGPWYRIVGVVPEVRVPGLDVGEGRIPALYLPLLQAPPLSVDLTVRAEPDPGALVPTLEAMVERGAEEVRLAGVATLAEELARRRAPLRWLGVVLGLAGAGVLLLAIQGLVSVMRYHVRRRRRELAVRQSVGATSGQVVWLVLRRTLKIASAGVLVGLWVSLPLVGWSEKMVPEGASLDPRLVGLILAGLLGAVLLGAAVPAWNAARTDPSVSLRQD